jgi:hypothetical protein
MNSSLSGDDDDSSSSSSNEELQPEMPKVAGSKRTPPTGPSHQVSAGDGEETSEQPQGSSGGPHSHDVLLGRGRPYQNFSGNKRMLEIVSRYKEEYSARPRDQKRAFVDTVLDVVLKEGTKFLRRVEETDGKSRWEEVDRTAAAEKVWHALRCKERPRRLGKRKAGDEVTSSERKPEGAHSDVHGAGSTMSSQTLQMANGTANMANAHAALRDVQQHLGNAIAAVNLLASVIRPTPSTGMGNTAAGPATLHTHGNASAQQSINAAAGLAGHDWLRGQGALGSSSVGQGNPSLPQSYMNMAGLASSPFVNPGLHGMLDMGRASAASAQQHHGQSNQSTNQSQALAQAMNILMQAAQQGTLPPP